MHWESEMQCMCVEEKIKEMKVAFSHRDPEHGTAWRAHDVRALTKKVTKAKQENLATALANSWPLQRH